MPTTLQRGALATMGLLKPTDFHNDNTKGKEARSEVDSTTPTTDDHATGSYAATEDNTTGTEMAGELDSDSGVHC